jgi:hypothetical protein
MLSPDERSSSRQEAARADDAALARRYLGLLKSSVLNELYIELEARLLYIFYQRENDAEVSRDVVRDIRGRRPDLVQYLLKHRNVGNIPYAFVQTKDGVRKEYNLRDVCEFSHTMIGRMRMDNLEQCLDAIRMEDVPGDLIETGVWRGGACIFMRGYLEAYGMPGRQVWVADSFQGLPKPTHPADEGWDFSRDKAPSFAIALDEVKETFRRYDLLDDRVRFLEGWFKDTLPHAPVQQLALIRLDGDLYESTMDALTGLYDRLSPGGFVIVDDYILEPCAKAIHEFRTSRNIDEELVPIDEQSVYWRRRN